MNEKYHYEPGAIHNDHHQELNIGSVPEKALGDIIKNFFKDGTEDAEFEEVENVKANEAETSVEAAPSMETRVKRCITMLREEKQLKHKYDYTWVMETMNQSKDTPKFSTPSSFIDYLAKLGFDGLPSEGSITKKLNVYIGTFPDWEFTDCDTTEANRRINIGKRFLNIYRNK